MPKISVLDDYQGVARRYADWSAIDNSHMVDIVREHLEGQELIDRISDSEIIIAMRERTAFPESVLTQLPKLSLLVTTGPSNASIDIAAAQRQGVTVCGTASGSTTSVPELTLGIMLVLMRQIVPEHDGMRRGHWQTTVGRGLAGRTLGIVGLGRLGAGVAKLASAFNMNVVGWSRNLDPERAAELGVQAVGKETLFRQSDIVSIHMRLTDQTAGLVSTPEFEWMKDSAYLINTSRGPLVDEQALIHALETRSIAGAGLDVYDMEPLPVSHPLRQTPNVLLLPHLGYVTEEVYKIFFTEAIEDVLGYFAGSPVRVLQPRAGGAESH